MKPGDDVQAGRRRGPARPPSRRRAGRRRRSSVRARRRRPGTAGRPMPSITQPLLRIRSKFIVAVLDAVRRGGSSGRSAGGVDLRQRYQIATERNGPPGLGQRAACRGLGQVGEAVDGRGAPTRTPRSPTGRTSGRFRAKIRNISAVQTPTPLIEVRLRDDRLVVPGVDTRRAATRPSTTASARFRTYRALTPERPTPRSPSSPRASKASGSCGSPARARSLASIDAAAFDEICWPMIARTSVPNRSGLGRSRQGRPGRSAAAHSASTPGGGRRPRPRGRRGRGLGLARPIGDSFRLRRPLQSERRHPSGRTASSQARTRDAPSRNARDPVGPAPSASGRKARAWSIRSSGSAQLNRRKPRPASPKHSPPRQATPKRVVGPFEQVQGQAVRGDPQAVADRRGRRGRRRTCRPAGRPRTRRSPPGRPTSRSTLRRNRPM